MPQDLNFNEGQRSSYEPTKNLEGRHAKSYTVITKY